MNPNPESNGIRVYTLSWNSVEIYALMFLLLLFLRMLMLQKDKDTDRRLIQMYILSIVFTDSTYRMASMQISELIIILAAMYDMLRHRFRIIINSLTVFMLTLLVMFFLSDVGAVMQGVYDVGQHIYDADSFYTVGNTIKYLLIIYMVSKIINETDNIDELMSFIRFGGNIVACVTIVQAIMFMAGFVIPGIFYTWGIPRANGLSHEPATNAFVLLMPMLLSLFYIYRRRYKLHIKSLILQMTAFFLCFSTGAIPIFIAALLIFIMKSYRQIKPRRRFALNMTLMTGVIVITVILCNIDLSAFVNLARKMSSLFTDYAQNTNVSGRGNDVAMLAFVMEHNFMFGVGAFNAVGALRNELYLSSFTNTYITFLIELGVLGFTVWFLLSLLFVRNFFARRKAFRENPYYANILAYFFVMPIMFAWIRIYFFHQTWIVLALAYLKQNPPCHSRQGG